jgi:hypothetical protein
MVGLLLDVARVPLRHAQHLTIHSSRRARSLAAFPDACGRRGLVLVVRPDRTQQDGEIGAASFRQNVYQNIAENITESV